MCTMRTSVRQTVQNLNTVTIDAFGVVTLLGADRVDRITGQHTHTHNKFTALMPT